MYNEERKERYLKYAIDVYSDDNVRNIRSLFNKTESVEKLFNKDVAEFSYIEISNMYSLFSYADEYTYSNINSKLTAYCEWANANNLVPDGCNHYREFVMEDLRKYVNKWLESQRYLTCADLRKFVSEINNPRDQFLIVCLFEIGKSEHFADIMSMKIDDIDEQSNTVILYSGRRARVSNYLIEIAKQANEEMRYYFPRSEKTKPLEPSPFIFKKIVGTVGSNDPMTVNKLCAKIVRNCVEACGMYNGINTSSIAVSGQLEMIRRRAKELGIDKRTYIIDHFKELQTQYEMKPNNALTFYNKYRAYL